MRKGFKIGFGLLFLYGILVAVYALVTKDYGLGINLMLIGTGLAILFPFVCFTTIMLENL